MSFEVRKFDHFISYQCYFGTRRYFFNKPNFLRYLTDNRCCYDHPQVFYRTYRITLSIVYELKSIDYSGIFNSVLNDSIFMAHKLWPTSNEIIQFIVEHYNINRSIWIRSSCGFSFWSINGWSHCFYRQHSHHYPLQWRYVSILQAGIHGRAVKDRNQ